ncbi:hypothetical protein TcCL_ESM04190, partial [Trypanosoma cruzi]
SFYACPFFLLDANGHFFTAAFGGGMPHGANEEMGARPSNSYPRLNPKLVTHREEIVSAGEDEPQPAPSPATPSLKRTANPAKKLSGKKTSTHVVSARKMERPSARNVSVGSASNSNLLRSNSLARPYGHTHSAVKNSTEKNILPDARREGPAKNGERKKLRFFFRSSVCINCHERFQQLSWRYWTHDTAQVNLTRQTGVRSKHIREIDEYPKFTTHKFSTRSK